MSDKSRFDPYSLPPDAIREPPESLWLALRKIGPGIILAGSIIGSGELILTTGLGADYGFMFLWLILFSCVIKVFAQIELGRFAISSATPTLGAINELPGPRFGAHWLLWWWLIMLLATVSQLGGMAGLVGQALNLAFPAVSRGFANFFASFAPRISEMITERPDYPWAILAAFSAVALLLSGGYTRIERITTFLIVAVTMITVVCVIALPYTGYPIRASDLRSGLNFEVFRLPQAQLTAALAAAFATFGITGVGATELYAYPYWCLEKGYARYAGRRDDSEAWARRAKGWVRVMILDAWVSMIVFTIATVSFYFLGATVLHRNDLHPQGSQMIAKLSEMYVPMFGAWTQVLFLIGATCVLFKTIYVASAGHARLTADFLNLGNFVQYANVTDRVRWIRRFCVLYPLGALVLYLIFGAEPKGMVIFGGFFQAITIPVIAGIAIYFRYRRTDPRLAPSRLSDILLWLAFVSIAVAAAFVTWNKFLGPAIEWLSSR